MIKIVADSTCDLSRELIEKYNIQIAPLHIVLGEKEFKDGEEISPDEIYAWADEHEDTPKTSAIGFEDVMDIMKPLVGTKDEMVVFTISGKMSTTVNVFRMVAEELEVEDQVSVIDSENLSTGIGLMVIKAAAMVQEGKNRVEICQAVEEMKKKVKSSFVVDTLTYLHRGGRCSSVAALAGGVLKLHPMIVVDDGKMTAAKKYRGKTFIKSYIHDLKDDLMNAKSDRVFITHSGCNVDIINLVYNSLKELNVFKEIIVTRAGAVISSHCGPGTLGVLFISKEK